jgi:hypothetical protein
MSRKPKPAPVPEDATWINGRQAQRIIGCAPSTLQRAAMYRWIRVQLKPGIAPRYHREDVEQYARDRQAGGRDPVFDRQKTAHRAGRKTAPMGRKKHPEGQP